MLLLPGQVGIPRALPLPGNNQLGLQGLAKILIDSRIGTTAGLQFGSTVDPKTPVHGYEPCVKSRVMSRTRGYPVAKVQALPVVTRCPRLDV